METALHAPRSLDYTPAYVLAGGGNPIAGFETGSATLRALYKPGSSKAEAAGYAIVSGFDEVLQEAISVSAPLSIVNRPQQPDHDAEWWRRWLAAVRDFTMAICDAYWIAPSGTSYIDADALQLRMAASVVEAMRWAACDRFSPDDALWDRLASVFARSADAESSVVGGDVRGVGAQYLRAIAYYSGNLDQLELETAIALMHVIDRLLPFLELSRKKTAALQYQVVPGKQSMPMRSATEQQAGAWYFSAVAADEVLARFQSELERGAVPTALGALPLAVALDAVLTLRRYWGDEPPVRRRRRYSQDAKIEVARGLEDCVAVVDGGAPKLPRHWQALDFSQSGLHIWADRDPKRAWPDIGELLGIHFVDGVGWQLGVVRRLRMWPSSADLGVELVARRPSLVELDDGRAPVKGILCDEIRKGEAVRVVVPSQVEFTSGNVALRHGSSAHSLCRLDVERVERDYRICTFQVL